MGKSIEEILKKIELERSQRINEEQSKLDQINLQRDLARKEWNKRFSIYEGISNNTSTSPAAGGGSIRVIEYINWIYISGYDLEYKVISFSPSSIEIESQNLNNKTVDVTYTPINDTFLDFGGVTQNLGQMTFTDGYISLLNEDYVDVLEGTYSLYSEDYGYTYSIFVSDTGVYNETIVPARLDYINETPFEGVRIGTFGVNDYLNGKTVSVSFKPLDDGWIELGNQVIPFNNVTASPYGNYFINYELETYRLDINLPIPVVDFKAVQLFDSVGGTQSVIFDNLSYGYQPADTAWSISGNEQSNSSYDASQSGDWSLVSYEAQRPSLIIGNSIGSLPPVYGGTTNLEVAFINGGSYDVTLYVKNTSGVSSKTKTIDVTAATPGIITGITYSLRSDAFTWIVDLVWNVNPLSVNPNINHTEVTAINGSATNIPISSISIFNTGEQYKAGAGVYFLKTSPTLTGNDTITISVLTTTGQYAIGSIGPLDFRLGFVATEPTVTSDSYGSVSNSSATVTGTITSDGGSAILERGIVWSTSPDPTILDNKVAGTGTAVGTFTKTYTIPNPYTYIYVRTYATNAIGTGYGTDLYFILPCFVKGTKITMFNGTKKNIEDISYEDNLLVWNFDDGQFDSAKPLWIMEMVKTPSVNILFSDGSKLGISGYLEHDGGHRIFNLDKGEFTYAIPNEHTPIGTKTFNDKGDLVTIVGKEEGEFAEIYNVVTNRHLNIFAEGMLTSRRLNNIYPISDMKFVKEERTITPIEEFKGITEEYYNGLRLGEQPIVKVSEGFLTKSPGELAYTLPTIEELVEWTGRFIQKKYEPVYEDTIS
jgi:hypothetical protein